MVNIAIPIIQENDKLANLAINGTRMVKLRFESVGIIETKHHPIPYQ